MRDEQLVKLIEQMTLEEKLCQMTQGEPRNTADEKAALINPTLKTKGLTNAQYYAMGSMIIYVPKATDIRKIQEDHLKNDRNKIPLLFMSDVVHGKETVFPIPLAMACSFDDNTVKEACRVSAEESSASGVHTVFAPATDLSRDARWGRVMESFGEDPYLSSRMTAAAVTGFQGEEETIDENHVSCCAKHWLGYGAVIGGRDYNAAEISDNELYNFYLPSFRAAADANVSMMMTSFNTLNGVPMTVNEYVNNEILRKEMGFDGVLITDYNSLGECKNHGISDDDSRLAELAINSSVDIEMMNTLILENVKCLVEKGIISENQIDSAVLRILRLKNKLGLFEDPFKGLSEEREKTYFLNSKHRQISRSVAEQSAVLLKNNGVLPLDKNGTIGLCGPLADSDEVGGEWAFSMQSPKNISLFEGLCNVIGKEKILLGLCDKIYRVQDRDAADKNDIPYPNDITAFDKCDTCVVAVGEHMGDTGEASSKVDIKLSDNQTELIKRLKSAGKKTVAVVFSGRPLDISEAEPYCNAVIYAWYLGCESGNALARLLAGEVNPSGRLAMSLPRNVGQCPIYYNHTNTGRPYSSGERFSCGYIDCENTPLFSFGSGLSYTDFEYKDISFNNGELKITVKNTGGFDGCEVIQLYVSLINTSVVRPAEELKEFKKVFLKAGEEKTMSIKVTREMLSFYKHKKLVCEKCKVKLFLKTGDGKKTIIYNGDCDI